jgi:GAF domain-containing protein
MADSSGGERFHALYKFFVDDSSLGDTLTRVAELACEVGPADMAGITMLADGKPTTSIFTDPEAPAIDQAQYETGVGPCLDAFRHQNIYRIESTEDDTQWPDFSRLAAAYGVRSTLSLPIVARDDSLGALNLYSKQLKAFTDDDVENLVVFAEYSAVVLANAQVYWDARELNENLSEAMHSRSTIDHAIGVLMARGGRDPQSAFQLLVRASQRENRKVREIAAEIVERASRSAPDGS